MRFTHIWCGARAVAIGAIAGAAIWPLWIFAQASFEYDDDLFWLYLGPLAALVIRPNAEAPELESLFGVKKFG